MKKILIALALFCLTSVALADNCKLGPCKKADLPTCDAKGKGREYMVKNCVSTSSCATTADPGFAIRMVCDYTGAAWAYRESNIVLDTQAASDFVPVTKAGQQSWSATGAGNDVTVNSADEFNVNAVGNSNILLGGQFYVGADGGGMFYTNVASNGWEFVSTQSNGYFNVSIGGGTYEYIAKPGLNILSGVIEREVTNVTVADDAAGTKPAAVIPITSDYVTCTCNDATGCAASVAEPTVTSGYGRELKILSKGTGNCEFTDSAGVLEVGTTVVLEPTSVLTLVYANAAWNKVSYEDNVP